MQSFTKVYPATRSIFVLLVLTITTVLHAQSASKIGKPIELKNHQSTLTGIQTAAEKGDAKSQLQLGLMYRNGDKIPKNEKAAVHWFTKAAEQDNVDAQFELGLCYLNSRGVSEDFRQAFFWIEKSASQGKSAAQNMLGFMHSVGIGTLVNAQLAVRWFLAAAEQDNSRSQRYLAQMYDRGEGVLKNEETALIWWKKAAELGDAQAQGVLGIFYAEGKRLKKDLTLAQYWFRKAAEQGDKSAQFLFGMFYYSGVDIPRDYQQAAYWFRKSAEQGDVVAQLKLGDIHNYGQGVAIDVLQAIRWYRMAAENGNAEAQMKLGISYAMGKGLEKGDEEAFFWLTQSAEQGNAMAQSLVGTMYGSGIGVEKNHQQAFFWYLLASQRGDLKSIEMRDNTAKHFLTDSQRLALEAYARNWVPKKSNPIVSAKSPNNVTGFEQRSENASNTADVSGSGFRIAKGVFLTNHHVTRNCNRLTVNGIAALASNVDSSSDLALLNAAVPGPNVILRSQRVAIGESVAVVGYPLRGLLSGFNMTMGHLSSLSGPGGNTSLLQTSAPVQQGNSGGPMLDSAGHLLGMVVSKLDALKTAKLTGDIPQNVNFAINVNVLRSFLDASGVEYETANSDKSLASTVIAERARSFTVLVECWK